MAAREPKPGFIVGDSIGDILAHARIVPGRTPLSSGRDVKWTCPVCNGGRTRELSLSVRLDDDGQGVTWNCKRGSCPGGLGSKGSGKIEGATRSGDQGPVRRERRPVVVPHAHTDQAHPASLFAFFAKRGISEETVREFGIYARSERWPKLDADGKAVVDEEGEVEWTNKATICFPYRLNGALVNRKQRSVDKQFKQDRDSLRSLYNADAITSPDEVILVEGEMDVLALHEAGFRQVASLPDGTSNTLLAEDDPKRQDDHRFIPLEVCADKLEPVQKFILATDGDVPGGYLAEEFARRLGRARCWRVTWPKGCKDANDVLLSHTPKGEVPTPDTLEAGREALRRVIARAEPWPLAGLVTIKTGQLSEFLRSGRMPRGLASGIAGLDAIAQLPAGPGWLTLVTGIPSHGKSTFVRAWLTYLAQKHDLGIVWCSPEDNRAETVALEVARIIAGQPLQEAGTYIPDSILSQAEEWIAKHITFVQSDDPDTEMTLDWILARAEEAKRRHARHLLVCDPWNEMEHSFDARKESETQYTGRSLRRIKAWGRAEGMSAMIVVHPKNQIRDPKTKKYPVVDGYDINGGANWNNKADLGMTIYRPEDGFVQAHCWKARFKPFGKRNGMARLALDPRSGRLSSVAEPDAPLIPEEIAP